MSKITSSEADKRKNTSHNDLQLKTSKTTSTTSKHKEVLGTIRDLHSNGRTRCARQGEAKPKGFLQAQSARFSGRDVYVDLI